MFSSYENGTRVWVNTPKIGWEPATVVARRDTGTAACELDVEIVVDGGTESQSHTLQLNEKNKDTVALRNPASVETSDLVALNYLNEPSVLGAIQERYNQFNIYTFSGIVLIATNPFDKVDNLYTDELVQMYSGRQRGELEPHLFSIAEDAYRCMQRDNRNQTIVVSGESGAGKTMSAKYIMRYFATVEDPQRQVPKQLPGTEKDGLSKVEREIMATNPILEAFGNAKTTRNDNSSRFGKYLEIRFDPGWNISGARIRTYLLERSRLVFHQQTERNYHIFYQLLRGLESDELKTLGLDQPLEEFHFLNQGDPDIAGIDDSEDFMETRRALGVVGVSGEKQHRVFEVLAGLLHLGNVELKSTSRATIVNTEDKALVQACKLLGLEPSTVAKWLTKKQLKMRSEMIESSLDLKAALTVRDSVAKHIYSALFDWLVAAINSKLYVGGGDDRFIGVLDIYGFEHFKQNSFEQFCINYANEKLQQEFNLHVFKLEQQEYENEEIDWQYIDFVDNQPCIALIEDRTGILSILDEESRLSQSTDASLTMKLYTQLEGRSHFKKPRLGESSFIVSHYAHDVEYETMGFIEKNRDSLPDTMVSVLESTKSEFLKEVLDLQASAAAATEQPAQKEKEVGGPKPPGGPVKRPTLGRMFKTSLIELMDTISQTDAHYIRCIKPNEKKEAWVFDAPMVLSQLRACGVLETIRISSKGFPGRWNYADFAARYDIMLHSSNRQSNDPVLLTKTILETVTPEIEASQSVGAPKMLYALGKTKVFLRAGMLGKLESMRTKRHLQAATEIQRFVKSMVAHRQFVATKTFVKTLQTQSRGKLCRIRAEQQLISLETVAFQSLVRGVKERKRFNGVLRSVSGLQNAFRIRQAQKNALQNMREMAVVQLQTLIRAVSVRNQHQKQVSSLVTVQSMVRRRGASEQLRKLKEDQHSVKHYEEKQYRMENKVVELQNALASKRDENKAVLDNLATSETQLSELQSEMSRLKETHSQKSKEWNDTHNGLKSEIEEKALEVSNLREELESQTRHIEQLKDSLDEREQAVQGLTMELAEAKQRLERFEEQMHHTSQIGAGAIAYHQRSINAAATGHQQDKEVSRMAAGAINFPAGTDLASRNEMMARHNEITDEIEQILMNPGLSTELISTMIGSIEVPTTALDKVTELDAKFPANITNLLVSEFWRFGHIDTSEQLISGVYKAVLDSVNRSSGDTLLNVAPFWMTNLHEIFSFFSLAETNIQETGGVKNQMDPEELDQYARLIQMAKDDALHAVVNIYWVYMKALKSQVDKMLIPAVVEHQAIPGFYTENASNRFLGIFEKKTQYTMDDLILFLTRAYAPLKAFRLEEHYIKSIFNELLTLIGHKSFNDLIYRRNFLSWRRGVQITYNVTRITEWCKGHDLESVSKPLDAISQASKVLQLKKTWAIDELNIIYDVCWSLNSLQIQRLVVNYLPTDYEPEVPQLVLKTMRDRVKQDGESKDKVMMPVPSLAEAGQLSLPPPRKLERLEPYIPNGVDVPLLRQLTDLTTASSRIVENTMYLDRSQQELNDGEGESFEAHKDERSFNDVGPSEESSRIS